MTHPYIELKSEYESWVANCKPLPGRLHEIDLVATRLTRTNYLEKFKAVQDKIGVPIVVQATICEREDGCDFTKSPAQGDPWNQVSRHVPRGIGPFSSWEESAIYSWTKADALNVNSVPWSLAYACYKWEFYNGGGYRAHGIRSPYVVGGTNLQQPGKYISDGEFDRTHMDTQLGCLPIAMRMIELCPDLALDAALVVAAAPSIIPDVSPAPSSVGGSLSGTKWVQASLNIADHIVPPLAIDGSFGKQTRAAVRKFQVEHGMPDTGYVDDTFCNAMDAVLAAARPA